MRGCGTFRRNSSRTPFATFCRTRCKYFLTFFVSFPEQFPPVWRNPCMSFNDHQGRVLTNGDVTMQDVATQQPSAFAEVFNDPTVGAKRANVAAGTVIYEPDDAATHVHFI